MRIAAAAILLFIAPATASAGCFENLGKTGCTDQEAFSVGQLLSLSCQNLWTVRNSIYDDHGYCFRTDAAKLAFDNSDCYESDAAKLRFNKNEQTNINRIVQVEKEKGCSAP